MDPDVWASLLTLTALEIVLGIDNVVFLSVATSSLPEKVAARARRLGLGLALLFRILLLTAIAAIIALDAKVVALFGVALSWKDMILLAGGAFLIYKAVVHLHEEVEDHAAPEPIGGALVHFGRVVGQIVLIDLVFSIDSIITAVGLVRQVPVMIAAVILAVAVMYVASGPVAGFISRHPTTKVLALAFLLLIGVALVADGLGFHIPREYIYSAMAFASLVEAINVAASSARRRRRAAVAALEARDPPAAGRDLH
ncbi:MAG: TerC family protein [Ancalomicrobiaceae bacterium]|nr:TerC family protein [Ancalomicrobiaceae bacterium]